MRQMTAGDIEELLLLRMEVLDAVFGKSVVDDAGREQLVEENRSYYERALRGGTHVACVAQIEGEVVGCGALCLQDEMPSPDNASGKCAYLMNIYTRPRFQRQGVGKAVVSWLVEQAQKAGADKIYLEATEAGKGLYTSCGFDDLPAMMILSEEK